MNVTKERTLQLLNNLFNPINNKDYGKYWFVSNNKRKPLKDANALLRYIRDESKNKKSVGAFINRYSNLTDDFIIENNIYLDFDLTNTSYLKVEQSLTETVLTEIAETKLKKGSNPTEEHNIAVLKQIKEKYSKNYSIENGFKRGFNSFIDGLTTSEIGVLTKMVKEKESKETLDLSEDAKQRYYLNKFERGYLKEPFTEAVKVASYFNSIGVETFLNWSGSKGLHLRIPITEINLSDTELSENPKVFLLSLAELIETKIIGKSKGTSSLDYNVFCKGMQRIPTSTHNKTKLKANFIEPTFKYIDAVDYLEPNSKVYIPKIINTAKNTEKFINSDIYTATIKKATSEVTKIFNNEDENPNYKFTGEHKELTGIIAKVYLPSCRNEVGFRIIHLLKRAGFTQQEVEDIFKRLHTDINDYKETIQGSINHAFKTDKLTGLKSLIDWLNENASSEVKTEVVEYFTKKFGYYDKPTVEFVGDIVINEDQKPIFVYENKTKKWLQYREIFKNIDLIINPTTTILSLAEHSTGKEIYSVEFKFKNKQFDLQKKNLEELTNILKSTKGIDIPQFFIATIRSSLNNLPAHATDKKILSTEEELQYYFGERTRIDYARKQLGGYLNEKGVILRKGINTPYYLNKKTNGFDSIEIDDVIEALNNNNDFEPNSISTDDVKTALTFIGDRRKPTYNIVKFKNCLYDIKKFEVIETTAEPVLTLTEVKYNYNPNAQGDKIIKFLKSSLAKPNDDEKMKCERVKGFLEFVGYILTSGNFLNCWFIFAGIGGAGKGVASRLITAIFGSEKVGHLQLQELTPDNRFATSHLENKQINIVTDSPTKPIEDTGMLKSITGYDDIPVEPKGKDKYMLPKEEVPDFLTVCNNIPRFKNGFSNEVIQRVVLFEFLNRFRGTDKQNINLEEEILNNPEEMEWLLYTGIESYRKMMEENKDFQARVDESKTMELLGKHTDPLSYILQKLVKFSENAETDGEDRIPAKELNKLILYVAETEGINIANLNKQGLINGKVLIGAIRREFGLDKNYTTISIKMEYERGKLETVRGYPSLYKTPQYDKCLNEMKEKETSD